MPTHRSIAASTTGSITAMIRLLLAGDLKAHSNGSMQRVLPGRDREMRPIKAWAGTALFTLLCTNFVRTASLLRADIIFENNTARAAGAGEHA